MKTLILIGLILSFLWACNKDNNSDISQDIKKPDISVTDVSTTHVAPILTTNITPVTYSIVGTWVEKYPELRDKISDTLVFTSDSIVYKHWYFNGAKFRIENDTIVLYSAMDTLAREIQFVNEKEFFIFNFLDRFFAQKAENIYYIKIKEESM